MKARSRRNRARRPPSHEKTKEPKRLEGLHRACDSFIGLMVSPPQEDALRGLIPVSPADDHDICKGVAFIAS